MSKIEVNAIEPQCGTDLTVGASGDTITFPTGTTIVNNGSQTGFGRTGTVDWITTPKTTGTFTAVSGEGYFCNTSGGVITANLPAGVAGAIVSFADYAATWQTNAVTVSPNGTDKIGSLNENAVLITEGQSVTFVYVDGTQGWINTMDSTSNVRGAPPFIQATGGTPSQDGDYEIRTFTGPGTFQVTSLSPTPANNAIDWVIIGGGGGGGTTLAGGGGAGGYKESPGTSTGSYSGSPTKGQGPAVTATITSYPIVIDGGGAGAGPSNAVDGTVGGVSSALGITSAGGGYGSGVASTNGGAGGSGGGGSGCGTSTSGGAGNTPPSSPSQGQAGGNGRNVPGCRGGGGGGGTGAAGTPGQSPYAGGAGGAGVSTSITGAAVSRGGGGGGGGNASAPDRGGAGGTGGGGRGGGSAQQPGVSGTVNTGGGGGASSGASSLTSGNGGSGIVIIRYKFQ